MATAATVETLRTQAIAIEPLRIEPVFDDPERVLAAIAERAPYPTLAKYHGFARDGAYASVALPWFRSHFDDDLFVRNPRWIEGAQRAFRAQIVRPLRCVLNIQPAAPRGAAHIDLPVFRGSHRWPCGSS